MSVPHRRGVMVMDNYFGSRRSHAWLVRSERVLGTRLVGVRATSDLESKAVCLIHSPGGQF